MKNNNDNGCDLCFKDLKTDEVVLVKEGKCLCEECREANEQLRLLVNG